MSDKYGFSVQDWEAAKGEMRRAMVERAKIRDFITYTELCEQVETLHLDPHSHAVAAMLGEIATAEDAAGRGIITAIVVYKSAGLEPGPGFFHIAKELGRDTSDRERFWVEELAAVHNGWSAASNHCHPLIRAGRSIRPPTGFAPEPAGRSSVSRLRRLIWLLPNPMPFRWRTRRQAGPAVHRRSRQPWPVGDRTHPPARCLTGSGR